MAVMPERQGAVYMYPKGAFAEERNPTASELKNMGTRIDVKCDEFIFSDNEPWSSYEGMVKVGKLGYNLGLKKEEIMDSVRVEDLWLVFPELTPASSDDSVGKRVNKFANEVRAAADLVRMNKAHDSLRWAFEDASIGSPVHTGKVEGGSVV